MSEHQHRHTHEWQGPDAMHYRLEHTHPHTHELAASLAMGEEAPEHDPEAAPDRMLHTHGLGVASQAEWPLVERLGKY